MSDNSVPHSPLIYKIGTFSGTSHVNGGSILGNTITLAVGDGTNPGMLSTVAQSIAGDKTFSGDATFTSSVITGLITGLGTGALELTSNVPGGGGPTMPAVIIDGNVSSPGDIVLSIQNNGTEVANVDYTGVMTLDGAKILLGTLYWAGSGSVLSTNASIQSGGNVVLGSGGALEPYSTTTLLLSPTVASGGTSVEINNLAAMSSGKLLSIQNNSVEKFYVGYDGTIWSANASGSINNLLPSQGSSAGYFLTTDGTNVSWAAAGSGLPSGGSVGNLLVNTGPGAGAWSSTVSMNTVFGTSLSGSPSVNATIAAKANGSNTANLYLEGTGGVIVPTLAMAMPGDTVATVITGFQTGAFALGGGSVQGFHFTSDGNGVNYYLAANYPDVVISTYQGTSAYHHYQSYNGSVWVEHINYGDGVLNFPNGATVGGTLTVGTNQILFGSTVYLENSGSTLQTNGNFYTSGGIIQSGSGTFAGSPSAFQLESVIADGASTIGLQIYNYYAYSTAGAKLLSVINGGAYGTGTEEFYIGYDGTIWTNNPTASLTNLLPSQSGANTYVLTSNGTTASWQAVPSGYISSITTIGSTPNADGMSVAAGALQLQPASSSYGGILTTGTQTIAGAKTFSSGFTAATVAGQPVALGNTTGNTQLIGSIQYTTRTLNASTLTIDTTTTDYLVLVTYTSTGSCTITMPAPTNGRYIAVLDAGFSAGTNNITINPHGSEKINNTSSYVVNASGGGVVLTSNGTDWFVVSDIGVVSNYITSLGAVGSSPNADAASVSTGVLTLQPADASHPGVILGTSAAQTLAPTLTFAQVPVASGLTAPASTAVTFTSNLASGGGGGAAAFILQANTSSSFSSTDVALQVRTGSLPYTLLTVYGLGGGIATGQYALLSGNFTIPSSGNLTWVGTGVLKSQQVSGTDAFQLNTTNAYSGGNLLNIENNSSSKFSIDYTGTPTVAAFGAGLVQSSSGGALSSSSTYTGALTLASGASSALTLGNTTGNIVYRGSTQYTTRTLNASTLTVDTTTTDYEILVTYTASGSVTITMPAPTNGRYIAILDAGFNAGTNNITINPNASEKINNTSSYVISANGGAVTLTSNGTDWFVVSTAASSAGAYITSLAAIGSSPNADAASVVGGALTLQPASASYGGVMTTGTQTIAGAKTFSGATTISSGAGNATTIGNTTGKTSIVGSVQYTYRTLNASTLTIDTTTTDYAILCTYTSTGACTITLPNPATYPGRRIYIKDAGFSAATHNITIARYGSEKIENVAGSYTINWNGGAVELETDGTNWFLSNYQNASGGSGFSGAGTSITSIAAAASTELIVTTSVPAATLNGTIGINSISGTFTTSDTVTGSVSGATGTYVSSSVFVSMTLSGVVGTFINGETLTGSPSGATTTTSSGLTPTNNYNMVPYSNINSNTWSNTYSPNAITTFQNADTTFPDPWGNANAGTSSSTYGSSAKLVFPAVTATNAYCYINSNSISLTASQQYTLSIFMRTNAASQNVYFGVIYASGGSAASPTTYYNSGLTTVHNGLWTRYTLTFTPGVTSTYYFVYIGFDKRSGGPGGSTPTTTLWASAPQLETGAAATNFIPVPYANGSNNKFFRGPIAVDNQTSSFVQPANCAPNTWNSVPSILESWSNQGIQAGWIDQSGMWGGAGMVSTAPYGQLNFTAMGSPAYDAPAGSAGIIPAFNFYAANSAASSSYFHSVWYQGNANTKVMQLDTSGDLIISGSLLSSAGGGNLGSTTQYFSAVYCSYIDNTAGGNIVQLGSTSGTSFFQGTYTQGASSIAVGLVATSYGNPWGSTGYTNPGSIIAGIYASQSYMCSYFDWAGNLYSHAISGTTGQLTVGGTQSDGTINTNLVGYSNTMQNWTASGGGTTGGAPTVTGLSTTYTDIYGGNTATGIVFAHTTTGVSNGYSLLTNSFTTGAGGYYTISVWMKAAGAVSVYMGLFTGSVGSPTWVTSASQSVTTSWKRFNLNYYLSGSTTYYFALGFDTRTGGPGGNSGTVTVYTIGAQAELTAGSVGPQTLIVTQGSGTATLPSTLVASAPPPTVTTPLATANTRLHSFQSQFGLEVAYINQNGILNSGAGGQHYQTKTLGSSTYTVDSGTYPDYCILVQTTSIAAGSTVTLPVPTPGRVIVIKDSQGSANTYNITIARYGSESIEGLAASYVMTAAWDSKTLISDGTNWFFI